MLTRNNQNYTLIRCSIDLPHKYTHLVVATEGLETSDPHYNEIAYSASHEKTVEIPKYESEEVVVPIYEKQLIDGVEAMVKTGEKTETVQKQVGTETVENSNYLSPFASQEEIMARLASKPEFN